MVVWQIDCGKIKTNLMNSPPESSHPGLDFVKLRWGIFHLNIFLPRYLADFFEFWRLLIGWLWWVANQKSPKFKKIEHKPLIYEEWHAFSVWKLISISEIKNWVFRDVSLVVESNIPIVPKDANMKKILENFAIAKQICAIPQQIYQLIMLLFLDFLQYFIS